jgi:hypothetical protein
MNRMRTIRVVKPVGTREGARILAAIWPTISSSDSPHITVARIVMRSRGA